MKRAIGSVMGGVLLIVSFVCAGTMDVQAETNINNMDFNSDYKIDIEDLSSIATSYNITSSSSNWNDKVKYDINQDNIIDIYDVVKISKVLGTLISADNIDITSKFTDEIFKNEVYKLIGKASPSPILYSDVKSVKELNLNNKYIKDFSGIEYFNALTRLECSNEYTSNPNFDSNIMITKIDLSNNTELTNLSCRYNKLITLDLSNNIKLEQVDCSANQLSTLNVSKNSALTKLDCYSNQLKNIDLSQNIELTDLKIYMNELTALDVSKNINLDLLECSNTTLKTLDVSKNTSLHWLWCNDNNLSTLDVSNNIDLAGLWCKGNQLTTLDVSKNTSLITVECYWNQITTLYSAKITWPEKFYKTQFTDAGHSTTTTSLVITLKN